MLKDIIGHPELYGHERVFLNNAGSIVGIDEVEDHHSPDYHCYEESDYQYRQEADLFLLEFFILNHLQLEERLFGLNLHRHSEDLFFLFDFWLSLSELVVVFLDVEPGMVFGDDILFLGHESHSHRQDVFHFEEQDYLIEVVRQ